MQASSPSQFEIALDDAALADDAPSQNWIGWISMLGYVALCGLVYLLH